MLIALMLADYKVLPQPLLYMSPWLERNKDEYIDRMFEVSKSGDWVGWIASFFGRWHNPLAIRYSWWRRSRRSMPLTANAFRPRAGLR